MVATTAELATLVDNAYRAMMIANRAPYSPERFACAERVFEGLVMAYAGGKVDYAAGLAAVIRDSGEPVRYYERNLTRGEIIGYGRCGSLVIGYDV
jgi:hypothetical protein